jgi:hypothetical protein
MTDAELDESVAAFCDEAENDAFEARAALLDSPDVISGASAWPPGGLPHGEHPHDYGCGASCTCWTDETNVMCPLHGMDAESPGAANSQAVPE